MTVQSSMSGEKELLSLLDDLGKYAVRDVMKPAVNKALTPVNKAAKRNAPTDRKELRKSLGKKVKARKDAVIGKILIRKGYKGAAGYGYAHEFGTRRMPARPFLRKALYDNRTLAIGIVKKEAWGNIKKKVARGLASGMIKRSLFNRLRGPL